MLEDRRGDAQTRLSQYMTPVPTPPRSNNTDFDLFAGPVD